MRGRFVILSVLWLLSSHAGAVAHAQEAPAPSGYEPAVTGALAAYEQGQFEAALQGFQAAHALWPNARTHRGIGIAALKLERYELAREHLRAALSDPRRPLPEALATKVRQALTTAEAAIAQDDAKARSLALAAPQPAPTSEQPAPVAPAAAPSQPAAPTEPAASKPSSFSPEGVAAESVAAKAEMPHTAPEGPSLLGPITVASVGLAALAAAGVTGLLARKRASTLEGECPTKQNCDATLASKASQGATLRDATNVLLVAGGATLGAGLLWWALLPAEESNARATLLVTPHALAASVAFEL